MDRKAAKEAILRHFRGDVGNVKEFLDAIRIAEQENGDMTLEELEEWGRRTDEREEGTGEADGTRSIHV